MDAQSLHWIYSEFFQINRDYILHLQQIVILIITATSIIFYYNKDTQKLSFLMTIGISFVLGIVNLIIGLHLYSNLLGTILDFATKVPELNKISCWIYIQFALGMINLLLVILSICIVRDLRRPT